MRNCLYLILLILFIGVLTSCTDKTEWIDYPTSKDLISSSSSEEISSSSEEVSSSSEESSSSFEVSSSSVEEVSSSSEISSSSEVSSSSSPLEISSSSVVSSSSSEVSSSSENAVSSSSEALSSSSSEVSSSSENTISSSSVAESSSSAVSSSSVSFCGSVQYDPVNEFCNAGDKRPYDRCGVDKKEYKVGVQECRGGIVMEMCGTGWIDPETHFCYSGNIPTELCGGKKPWTVAQRCLNEIVEDQCTNSEWYDSEVKFCANNTVYNKCGGTIQYNPATELCCGSGKYIVENQFCATGNVIYDKCGGIIQYDPATEQCCGNDKYTVATHFCSRGNTPKIVERCGGKAYNGKTHFCDNNEVIEKCGGVTQYDPATEQCCGSSKYATATQFCYNSKVGNKCGTRTEVFDPDLYECKSGGKIYLKTKLKDTRDNQEYEAILIGTQTWMAKNLNYNASGSVCYNNQTSNCTTYGRLYDWAMAMNLPSSCNSSVCSSQINTPHRGICPQGWHIPNEDEWTTLMVSVGGTGDNNLDGAGKALKATSGWDDCGSFGSGKTYSCEDTFGFAALPGGGFNGNTGSSFDAGEFGYWFSAEYETDNIDVIGNNAYIRYMSNNNERAYLSNGRKVHLRSFRCVMD